MSPIVWQDPPPSRSNTPKWRSAVIAELKQHPGAWALVEPGKSSGSYAYLWRRKGCEATSRLVRPADGKPCFDIYARWPETK